MAKANTIQFLQMETSKTCEACSIGRELVVSERNR